MLAVLAKLLVAFEFRSEFLEETSGNHWSPFFIFAVHLTLVLLFPQVVGLLFSSQYGGSHQAAGSAHSGRHHGHQTLLLWPNHP